MADRTPIEWTDASWTPIRARWIALANDGSGVERVGWHCEHVSEGCRNCYSEAFNQRLGTQLDFKPSNLFRPERVGYANGAAKLFLDETILLAPLRWRRPRKIFVCSMTDLFGDWVPDKMIDQVFAVMALAPLHTFQLLTKRPARMRAYLSDPATHDRITFAAIDLWVAGGGEQKRWQSQPDNVLIRRVDGIDRAAGPWPLPNVWLGTSCEDQATADARIPELLATPATIRFVSAEPLLGPIDFDHYLRAASHRYEGPITAGALQWIIVGGESGPGARPMHPDWARSLRDQCKICGVAFLHKHNGAFEVAIDRDRDDPDWRRDYKSEFAEGGRYRWLNLAGGRGFHGESFLVMRRVGKRAAGRLLDGVTHDGFPEVRHG